MAESQGGEKLAWGAAADGGVVLEFQAALDDFWIAAGKPSKTQPGKAVRLAHGAQADSVFVRFASGGEARGRVVLEFAIDFVREDNDVATGGQRHDLLKGSCRHEEAGGVVRRVDVNDFGVWPDQFFQGGNIVCPAILESAAPLADLCTGAASDLEATLVTRRFDDDMIARSEQRVIQHENAFFGRG